MTHPKLIFRNSRESFRSSRKRNVPRWAALLGGGALAAFGVSRRSKMGAALAAAGGALIFTGTRLRSDATDIHAQASFTINCSPEHAYNFWRNLENLPKFMTHLQSVRTLDNNKSEWVARGPLGTPIRWTAQITDERQNEWIVWQSQPGSLLENRGSVQFTPAPENRGTQVSVAIEYMPPGGPLGRAFAALFGKDPQHVVREDLRHFKQLIEAGEIPTTIGQSHGRRSFKTKVVHSILEDQPRRPISKADLPGIQVQEKVS